MNIGPFKKYTKEPNDICYGSIYTYEVSLPIFYYKERIVRLYLPEDYDKNKSYPLLIMADGQNIVDKYTSAYGAWEIDKRQHELIKEGYSSFIVLGIDCPVGIKERALEYSFPFMKMNKKEEGKELNKADLKFESHLLFHYIVDELIPLVKKYFKISEIASGGSSMGGVFSLALLTSYSEVFSTALSFSPAYFLYNKKTLDKYMDKAIAKIDKNHKFFFYVGGVGFESKFVNRCILMNNYLVNKGYNTKLVIDESGEHNEATWSSHFNEAIRYWLRKDK